MHQETNEYLCGKIPLKGYIAYNEASGLKRPAVLVAHAWRGQDDFAREKARMLAEMGYVGFAADVYGHGKCVESNEEAAKLMMPLFIDRKLLQERIRAAFDMIRKHPLVDPERIGAIGFCFGGLTVIELLRSGAEIKGAVSFHGVLGSTLNEAVANPMPIASKVHGALLALHGNDDPMVTAEDIKNLQAELTGAKVDWQMNIYGHAVHAFTNPMVHDPASGMAFNPKASRRSWKNMSDFFIEIFEQKPGRDNESH